MQVTSLSAAEAEFLLHHLKWNKDELLNRYLADDDESLLREAGLRPNMDMSHSAGDTGHVECPVCLEPFADAAALSLACGHTCCNVSETVMLANADVLSPLCCVSSPPVPPTGLLGRSFADPS